MWPTAVQNHLDADLPMRHDYAFHAWVKTFDTGTVTKKGVWTGEYNLTITLDAESRTYEGAEGSIVPETFDYEEGLKIKTFALDIGVFPESIAIIQGYNTLMAPADVWCLCFDSRDQAYLGARRMFKGYMESTRFLTDAELGNTVFNVSLVSQARKGEMVTTGKKSNASQRQRNANDALRKWSDRGTVQSDVWGTSDED